MKEKIITVDLKKSKIIRANSQWQYNYGQKLKFKGVELPPTYQVHFSNSVKGEAKTQIGDSTGVLIPPEYFIPGSEIHAWIHLQDEDSGVTEWEIVIPILNKALPIDQDPDEHETTVIDEAINALNNALETVDDRIDNALQEAKESGEFDGEDGVSPVVRTEEIEGGTRIIITDATGDHSFDVMDGENITEIVYFYGSLLNGRLPQVTMDHFGFDDLRNCINAGKTPIGIITIPSMHPAEDSHGNPVVTNEMEYLVMSLTEWYKDKADLVSGSDGDDYFGAYRGVYATFSSVIQNNSYTLNLEWSIRKLSPLTYGWVWTLVPTTLATVGDLGKKIKYFEFTINYDVEYTDGSNGIDTLCQLSDIQDAYDGHYVIFAKLIDNDSDIILPLVIPPRNYGQSYDGSGQIISDGYWKIMFGMDMRIPSADAESPDELYPVYRIILDYDSFRPDDQEWRVYQNEAETLPDLSAYRTAAEQDIIDNGQNNAINLKYTKPSGGILKTDLAQDVQTSLDNAINEIRYYDPIHSQWEPYPITNKGVNLPDPVIPERIAVFNFTVDTEDLTVTTTVNPPSIPPYQSGDNFVSVAKVQYGEKKLLLPLTEWKEYPLKLFFCGKISDTEMMSLSYDGTEDSWTATVDTFGQQYVDDIATDLQEQIGNLSDLQTTDKSNLVDAINEVVDSSGGTSNYNDLSNKPQINSVTLSGNKSLNDLGIAAASDIHNIPSGGTANQILRKSSSLNYDAAWSDDDIVAVSSAQPQSDTNLLWIKSGNPQTVQILTKEEVEDLVDDKVDKNQGMAHAGEFLVVGSDGNVTTAAIPSASGVSF